MTKKECTLEADIFVDLDHGLTPFDIFQMVTGMYELLKIIVTELNRYTSQKGHNFETTEDEMKASIGINFTMGINKLPSLEDYWSTDKDIENEKIQNDNDDSDKIDKSYKIGPVIEHLKKIFAEILSNSPIQSIDKHMCKFKGKSSMKQ